MSKKKRLTTKLFAFLSAFAVSFSLFSPKAEAQPTTTSREVTVIKEEKKLDALRKEHKIVVLFVHMKGCPPCQRFTPKFEQLTRKNERKDVFFAKIEKNNAKNLRNQYSIKMYPTVLIFQEGELKKQFQGCSQCSVQFFKDEINALLQKDKT